MCGIGLFVFGNPYFHVWPTNGSIPYYIALMVIFLAASVALRLEKVKARLPQAWRITYSFFMATAAMLVLRTGVLNLPRTAAMSPMQDLAIDKFSQFLAIVPVLLILAFVAGIRPRSLFIRAGRLKGSLLFGGISFVVFGAIAFLVQPDLSSTLASLPSAVPWLLIFAFSNAIMEEMWLRGIFLKGFEPLIGRWLAILVTAIIFGAAHYNATYAFPGGPLVFAGVNIVLGFVGAWAMMKYDSLIGPVLFHAGYDLIIVMSVLAS